MTDFIRSSSIAIIVACSSIWPLYAQQPLSTWTDLAGKFTVEAEFIKLDGDNVVLKRSDGETVNVAIAKLSLGSQLQARRLADPNRANEAGALSLQLSPPPVLEISASATAQQAADILYGELKKNNWLAVWDMLPKKYQADIETIVGQNAAKIGPIVSPALRQNLDSIVNLLKSKKSFVLGSNHLKNLPVPPASIDKSYDQGVELISSYLDVFDLLNAKQTKDRDLRTMLHRYLSNIVRKATAFANTLPADSPLKEQFASGVSKELKYTIEQKSGDLATITLTVPNAPAPVVEDLIRVEGRWIPKKIAVQWDLSLASANAKLGNLTPAELTKIRQNVTMASGMLAGFLAPIQNAQNQAEFDEAIEGILALAGPFLGQVENFAPAGATPAGAKGLEDIFGTK